MYKCKNCGAPLDGIICSYCDVRNEIDLKHRYDIHTQTDRVCPSCEIYLDTLTVDKSQELYIEQCKHCHGIFLDYGELEAIMEREIIKNNKYDFKKLRQILDNPISKEKEIKYKKCPECKTMMSRLNYKQKSGVIIDCCISCGYWLDGGELRQIMEWAKLSAIDDFAPTFEREITFSSSTIAKEHSYQRYPYNKYQPLDLIEGFMRFLYRA